MQGISIKEGIGIGDAIQFTSLPENYYRAKGEKLIDVSKHWVFDHSKFVSRETIIPDKVTELWNFPPSPTLFEWPNPRNKKQKGDWREVPPKPAVYLSNAEIWASTFEVPVVLNRPKLYFEEDYPYNERKNILLQTEGRSHGHMPEEIVHHVIKKYGSTHNLIHIGEGKTYGLPHRTTPGIWDLVRLISKAKMVIGLDSGPAWIACCYSDVITKVVRTKPLPNILETWVPLDISNLHSFWDDRCRMVYNPTDRDIGFTQSFLRI